MIRGVKQPSSIEETDRIKQFGLDQTESSLEGFGLVLC